MVAQMVKNLPAMQETLAQPLSWEDPRRRAWQSTSVFLPRESHGQRSWRAAVHRVAQSSSNRSFKFSVWD